MLQHTAPTSILIPVYNGMPYLEEAINSVLQQTQSNWNLIIADNCSNDGTSEYLSSLNDNRISIHKHSKNIGAAKNWEYLYKECSSKYACILGADDIMKPTFIERSELLISESEDIAFVHSASDLIDGNGTLTGNYSQNLQPLTSKKDFIYQQWICNQVNVTTCLFSIQKAKELGVKFDSKKILLFDWALWFDIHTQFKYSIYINEPLCQYRQHANNTTARTHDGPAWTLDRALIVLERLLTISTEFQPENIRNIGNRILLQAIKKSILERDLKITRQGLAALILYNSPREFLSLFVYLLRQTPF